MYYFTDITMNTNQSESVNKTGRLHEITYWGIRASVGVIFIAYGLQKFDPIWREHLMGFGLPPELQIPIALAETIGGISLIVGVLTRITGVIFSIILVDAIFHIRWNNGFFIAKGGWDFDLALIAMILFIIVMGSGRISISSRLKKIPSFLQ
jgi:putative oxidoreductase